MLPINNKKTIYFLLLILLLLLAACSSQDFSEFENSSGDQGEVIAETGGSEESSSGPSAPGMRTFLIDPVRSEASYLVDEEFFDGALSKLGIGAGEVDVVGTTQDVQGQIELNFEDLSAPIGQNEFNVNLSLLATDQDRRDDWIQNNGPNFGRFPQATFVVTEVSGLPGSVTEGQELDFQMTGDLTIRDVTQPVTFDVTATLEGDTLTGQASNRLLMSDFGIEPPSFANTLTVQDEFGIVVNFVAIEQ